jgi:hypothetical protein
MIARRLGVSDLPQLRALIISRSTVGKETLEGMELQRAIERLDLAMSTPGVYYWGAFEHGRLACFLTQVFDERFSDCWNMSFLLTADDRHPWDYRLNGLDEVWKAAFIWGNYKQRRRVVWSLPTQWSNSYRKTLKRSNVWPAYDIQDLRTVPSGTVPEDAFEQFIFGTRPKSYDVVLRTAVKQAPVPAAMRD